METNNRNASNAARKTFDPVGYANTSLQCDEYPFASTYEGAAASIGTGLPPVFSAKEIPKADNGNGGGRLKGFYQTFRIIEGDKFFVAVRTD